MTNTKNKFVRVSLIVFVCILSAMLLFMPFLIKDKRSVFADTSVSSSFTFTSSDIVVPITLVPFASSDFQNSITGIANMHFNYHSPNETYNDPSFFIHFDSFFILDSFGSNNGHYSFHTGANIAFPYDTWIDYTNQVTKTFTLNSSNTFSGHISGLWVYVDTGFSEPIGLTLSSNLTTDSVISFDYFDANGKSLKFNLYFDKGYFPSYTFGGSNYTYDSYVPFNLQARTYYFNSDIDLSNNTYYQQGKQDGLQIGRAEGDSTGYDRGFREGKEIGKSIGYNEGTTDAGHYSFLGLIAAAIDAPVQAFNGLFDFNLSFGDGVSFNLKSFIIAMLTIALVIAFIRVIMAK